MKSPWYLVALFTLGSSLAFAGEAQGFPAYIDSDLCSRLMLGPISMTRVECSQQTVKDGALPVAVRLKDNLVFEVNKHKMLKEHVGKLAEVTGEAKPNEGRMKLESVKPLEQSAIPAGDASRRLLDVRMYRTAGSDKIHEKIRHELAMMPYLAEFDYISFTTIGNDVILSGWTLRSTNRSTAANLAKDIEGVERVVNNIEVLPLGRNDMQIRAAARANLQKFLSRYFWGSGSDIKIIVKNGNIILLGTVATKADSDIAYIQCNSVRGAFKVFNMLHVNPARAKS